jgi:hypothetical protein
VPALLDGSAGKLAIGPVRRGGRDASALVVGGTSGPAGTRSFSMQVSPHLLVVRVVSLDLLTLGKSKSKLFYD